MSRDEWAARQPRRSATGVSASAPGPVAPIAVGWGDNRIGSEDSRLSEDYRPIQSAMDVYRSRRDQVASTLQGRHCIAAVADRSHRIADYRPIRLAPMAFAMAADLPASTN